MSSAALAPAGPRGPKRAAHQILTIECARCGQGWQEGAGERVPIDKAALERAHCDAERIDPNTGKITQDIPERIRRLVFRRDGRRCTVPGYRSRHHLAVHHITPLYANGGHEVENLTVLCGGHHRALHDGLLAITGRAPHLTYEWTRQRDPVEPPAATPSNRWREAVAHVRASRARGPDARDAITALVTMGYKPAVARAAVERAIEDVGELPVDQLVPAALRRCAR